MLLLLLGMYIIFDYTTNFDNGISPMHVAVDIKYFQAVHVHRAVALPYHTLLVMNVDSRGVRRGGCEVCSCVGYDGGTELKKCVNCGHPPGRHVNLDNQVVATVTTSPASNSISMQPPPATQADANVSHGGPFSVLSSFFGGLFATKKTQSHHIMDGIKVTPATGCAAPGCNRPVDFDANTGKEYGCCREHHGSVSLPPLACVQVQSCEQDGDGLFGGGESLSIRDGC